MSTPPPLRELYEFRERMTKLEYGVVEQIPAAIAAMNHGATRMYAKTVANGETIAGLRVDMGGMQTRIHGDIVDLKTALDLQADSLRTEIGVQAAALGADMTAFREAMSQRFERVDTQFRVLRADTDERFEAVDQRFDAVDQRFDAVDQRFDAVDRRFDAVDQRFENVEAQLRDLREGIDTIIGELRRPAE